MTTPVKKSCNGCGSKSRAAALAAKAPVKTPAKSSGVTDAWKAIVEKKRSVPAPVAEVKKVSVSKNVEALAVSGDCSNEISYCVIFEVPTCFEAVAPTALFDVTLNGGTTTNITQPQTYAQIGTCGLTCESVARTTTQTVSVTSPCDPLTAFTCDATVSLDYTYVRGSVDINVGMAVQPIQPSDALLPCALGPQSGARQDQFYSYISRTVKVCVDNLVCVSCTGGIDQCGPLFAGGFIASCSNPGAPVPIGSNCDAILYQVSGTFLLNSCPIVPPP